jgi:hypothetical protein
MKFLVPLLLLAFLHVSSTASAQSKDKCDLVITNVTLIDGTGAEPQPGMAVTIKRCTPEKSDTGRTQSRE